MMHIAPALEGAVLSLGGYTSFLPDAWHRYLRSTIRSKHPGYFLRHLFDGRRNQAWKTNDCILTSLREYLLDRFGILLPRETLFAIYNEDGQGILPGKMIDAISAVIEPVGLEIEAVIVVNPLLRKSLGRPDKIMPSERFGEFYNRPGLCMINIDRGHSHAFYWKNMDARNFASEKFRVAMTIRRKDGQATKFSALNSLDAYSRILKTYASGRSGGQQLDVLASDLDKMLLLARGGFKDCPEAEGSFRQQLSNKLTSIHQQLKGFRWAGKEAEMVRHAGEMVERIFREVESIA